MSTAAAKAATLYYSAARLEDAEWMAETGESLTGAARRLGYRNVDSFERFLRDRGRLDILKRLNAQEPTT